VTIGTGVSLSGMEIGGGALPFGKQFNIVDNTSPNPTFGIFAGLDEGASFAVGSNLFRISYVGGDGNDVVLTNTIPEAGICQLAAMGAAFFGLVRRRARPMAHLIATGSLV
jgi:hypothetical protein